MFLAAFVIVWQMVSPRYVCNASGDLTLASSADCVLELSERVMQGVSTVSQHTAEMLALLGHLPLQLEAAESRAGHADAANAALRAQLHALGVEPVESPLAWRSAQSLGDRAARRRSSSPSQGPTVMPCSSCIAGAIPVSQPFPGSNSGAPSRAARRVSRLRSQPYTFESA